MFRPDTLLTRRCLVLGGAAAFGLNQRPAQAQAAPPQIVASFSVLADMARHVAPLDAVVSALVGPDADTHVFEPTPANARQLAHADVVLVNGLGFEGWMQRLVNVSGFKGAVVVASHGVKPPASPNGASQHAHGATHFHAGAATGLADDPHAWQDLAMAKVYVANLRSAFVKRWPQHRAQIVQRSDAYLDLIEQLDQRIKAWFRAIPRAQRRVITTHSAFNYFGAAYGVDFVAAQGWNAQGEPSAAAVARLIRQIRQEKVTALFVENISDRRLIDRIAKEGGARVGGTLYSDALSQPGGAAPSYLAMMEHNARTVLAVLGR